ncbi:Acyl-CoA N-acyltransferase [Cordyceps fumosorosea ARSEF 2679]|uniref:Acyl-CoA N-acyltransferase n=1 Tax=Cordyceps fumosorosea (strain ARSEF 2679) TaxID=1081104 RepID=A0A162J373_CORFA|nr:Acyl-CoA N-acyltransferase [Cordyceps fumosorosea ARSEF 2679]OAA63142.1 Acyl-CoA N-acyltransferase [Cordyceps fumosorosea ARSEF 2679]
MTPETVCLPDGQTYTVSPVFGGVAFKSNDLTHGTHFPVGWNIALHTEEEKLVFEDGSTAPVNGEGHGEAAGRGDATAMDTTDDGSAPKRKKRVRPFSQPTRQNDTLFISSLSTPSSQEYGPPASPTRQIAMILWVSLYWYFHQREPSPHMSTEASHETPDSAKPMGEWRITIQRDGVLRGRNLIPKLERMGLLATQSTDVGTSLDDSDETWSHMFVSQRMFWQLPPNLFLFTLKPVKGSSPWPGLAASPNTSRPGSPAAQGPAAHFTPRAASPQLGVAKLYNDLPGAPIPTNLAAGVSTVHPITPFFSTSHLPTYYPPLTLQYTFTGNLRHPLRPKPPRMGELFYSRFLPSVGRYLSFRVASLSPEPVPYFGPLGPKPPDRPELTSLSDAQLLESWFAKPRVAAFWGKFTPEFLPNALQSNHSFPAIGLWDGVPFGYFEIYWVKEDILGKVLGGEAGDFDRGLHVMVGEEWARGRASEWMTSLVHWCFTTDMRTMNICLEPRIDNDRILKHLDESGFGRERQISFPHKQSWYVRLRRETWTGPLL